MSSVYYAVDTSVADTILRPDYPLRLDISSGSGVSWSSDLARIDS